MMTTGGFSYPTTLVVDSQGQVANVWRDKVTKKVLEQAIEQAKKSVPKS
jgi:peroxiredoxin